MIRHPAGSSRRRGLLNLSTHANRTEKRPPKPWSKKSPEGPWDAIVIGSGMGGMTSAALLAHLGQRVLVLEQHYVPGGFTHTFKRRGYLWDVGVHAVGEVTDHSMPGRLLARLTEGGLQWAPLGKVYDEFWYPDDFRVDFPDSPQEFNHNLCEAFPHEAGAIGEYIQAAREVSGAMKGYYLGRTLPRGLRWLGDGLLARRAQSHLETRTQDVIQRLTRDEKLRSVFAAQWGYYGSPPSRSSFAIQALVVKHFLHGGYYPVGGSRAIATQLLGAVANRQGWTRIGADVEEILVEGGRAVGVRLTDGEEIRGKKVLSAVGAMSTCRRLLPEALRGAPWANSITSLRPAAAHVSLYLGFRGDIRRAGAGAANKWFYETWDPEVEGWNVEPGKPVEKAPILYCSFPSLKDPTHSNPERHTGEVVTFVPWESFERWRGTRWRDRGDDYLEFKQAMEATLLEQFLEHMPDLAPMVDYHELSTPLSTDHFVRPMAGSIYGIEPTPERFRNRWLRPQTPIEGLFLSGSEITSVGVVGAMMGGVLAVAAAEPMATMDYLRKL